MPTGPLGSADTSLGGGKKGKDGDGEEMSLGDRAISLFGGKPKKKKEAKPKDEEDGDLGFGDRAMSLFGGKKKPKDDESLPPNWKKAKDKDGKVYFFNSVTQVRQYTTPRKLPNPACLSGPICTAMPARQSVWTTKTCLRSSGTALANGSQAMFAREQPGGLLAPAVSGSVQAAASAAAAATSVDKTAVINGLFGGGFDHVGMDANGCKVERS